MGEQALYEEIEADRLKPTRISKRCKNPFEKKKRKNHRWTEEEINLIHLFALKEVQKAFQCFKERYPTTTYQSLKRKVAHMGYRFKKGVICKR